MKKDVSSSAKLFTHGGQMFLNNLRMFLQVNAALGKWGMWVWALCFVVIAIFFVGRQDAVNSVVYGWAKLMTAVHWDSATLPVRYGGRHYAETAGNIVADPFFAETWARASVRLVFSAAATFVVGVSVNWFGWRFFLKQGREATADRHVRGPVLATAQEAARAVKKRYGVSDVKIDALRFPPGFEARHVLLHGTTGAGKTQALMKFLDAISGRGDKAVVADSGGVLTRYFYREGIDAMLAPLDARTVRWDLWAETDEGDDERVRAEFDNVARALIPLSGREDPFWVNAARSLFSAAAMKMKDDKDRSATKLLRLLLREELSAMHEFFRGTDAAPLADRAIKKTTTAIRAIIAVYLKPLRLLDFGASEDGGRFSVRRWLLDDGDRRRLFLPYLAKDKSMVRPLISLWLDLVCLNILHLGENEDRRVWVVLDELASLHRLPSLANVAEVRKFGGCFVLGIQNVAQMIEVYGREHAESLLDLLNTRFFFQSNEHSVARWASGQLGEREIDRVVENYSYGASQVRDGVGVGRQRHIMPLASYSEIQLLDPLSCYVKTYGDVPVALAKLRYERRRPIAAATVGRAPGRDDELDGLIRRYERQYELLLPKLKSAPAQAARESRDGSVVSTAGRKKKPLVSKAEQNKVSEDDVRRRLVEEEQNINPSSGKGEPDIDIGI